MTETAKVWTMRHRKTICPALFLALAAVMDGACHRQAPASRITSVEARIDGLTCPTCVPPLRASLKRQYATSAIDVDDDKDTATIKFAGNEGFSIEDFRAAVERVRMRVVTVRMQACGTVDASNGSKYLTAGTSRFLVRSEGDLPVNQPLCLDGMVDPASNPATFQVSAFSVQRASGS